jgi:hypothetical protein
VLHLLSASPTLTADNPTSIASLPSEVDATSGWHAFGTTLGSTASGNLMPTATVPSSLPASDYSSVLHLLSASPTLTADNPTSIASLPSEVDATSGWHAFGTAPDLAGTGWWTAVASHAGDYGVASGADQSTLYQRLSDANSTGEKVIAWTLIYEIPKSSE